MASASDASHPAVRARRRRPHRVALATLPAQVVLPVTAGRFMKLLFSLVTRRMSSTMPASHERRAAASAANCAAAADAPPPEVLPPLEPPHDAPPPEPPPPSCASGPWTVWKRSEPPPPEPPPPEPPPPEPPPPKPPPPEPPPPELLPVAPLGAVVEQCFSKQRGLI